MMTPGGFLRWWTTELGALWSSLLGEAAGSASSALILDVGPEEIVVAGGPGGRETEWLRQPRGTRPDPRALSAVPRAGRCRVRLSPGLALVREATLPLAVEENLRESVGFEMERLTPFSAHAVYFDVEVLRRDPERRQLAVRLWLAPRAVVDEALALLPGFDPCLEPGTGAASLPEGGSSFGFVRGEAPGPSRWRVPLVLGALNLVLLAVLVALPMIEQRRALEAIDARLAEVRRAAEEGVILEARIAALREEAQALARSVSTHLPAVVLLEELSARLPDDTWLQRLEVRGGTLHVQGSSATASTLVGLLEDSRLLSDARFASPVVREGPSGRERFHLQATLVPDGAPLAVASGSGSGPKPEPAR